MFIEAPAMHILDAENSLHYLSKNKFPLVLHVFTPTIEAVASYAYNIFVRDLDKVITEFTLKLVIIKSL